MLVIVADSSVLIALAKLDRLDLMRNLYESVAMTPAVYSEVVEGGRGLGASEVRQIESALSSGWVKRVSLSPEERGIVRDIIRRSSLGRGESECLAVASSRSIALVIDDFQARAAADALGTNYFGTAGLLLRAHRHELLSYEELAETLRDLTDVIWISPAVVAEILRRAREVDHDTRGT